MLRSCLIPLSLYAALSTAYWWWLRQQFDPPGVWIGAAVVGLIVTLCIGALLNSRMAFREWSLVSSARHDLPWSDGRWTALAGEIHPVGEPLVAPFSGKECVLCEYEVAEKRASSSSDSDSKPGLDFAGFLMNPCVVRTRMGDVRLLGFPNLEGVSEDDFFTSDAVRRARDFLLAAEFEDYSGLKLVGIIRAIKEAWTDDDGFVRKNIRLSRKPPQALFPLDLEADLAKLPRELESADPASTADGDEEDYDEADNEFEDEDLDDETSFTSTLPMLKEKRVDVGVPVCAIGVYSGEKRGLIPGGSGVDRFIRLIRGKIDQVESRKRNSAFANLVGGLVVLIIVNAAAYGVMMANRYHPSEVRRRNDAAFQAATKDDVPLLAKLIARGVEINGRNSEGRTLLLVARDPAVARWLIDHGADVNVFSNEGFTPLMDAARFGRVDMVQVLIDRKADLNLRSKPSNQTALELAAQAGHEEVAGMLRTAGAKE